MKLPTSEKKLLSVGLKSACYREIQELGECASVGRKIVVFLLK